MLIIKKTSNGTAKIAVSYKTLIVKVFCYNQSGRITQDGFLSFDDSTQMKLFTEVLFKDEYLDFDMLFAYGMY